MHSPNRLIHETSPYLLQHAHNPVDWYPWGDAALEKARRENKPILVSIGYSACHWCHVMERESFEDPETAALMNQHFINIKIDREERPDLDHIYMDAVQAMTGSGGWPLNVFLTPDKKPFYGGTYFPPRRAYNRASWSETILGVAQAFAERRHEVDAQAENLTQHLLQAAVIGTNTNQPVSVFSRDQLDIAVTALLKTADTQWGGFGKAPKFPQTFSIRFLLRHFHFTGQQEALDQALLSLDKMCAGGIYDHIGGGFARYSTDAEWLAPHFEKMLYDNALLVSVLAEAFQLTGREQYKQVLVQTLDFVQRELLDTEGGFYAALDADIEGVEGKFYTWPLAEVEALLGEEAPLFCQVYDITAEGNWEHTNIPWLRKPLPEYARASGMEPGLLEKRLAVCREQLLEARAARIRPQLDDKIILGWNALMNQAFTHAWVVTRYETYRELAVRNMEFLCSRFAGEKGRLKHTWKNGEARFPAFLDDMAYLVQALLRLFEITADYRWIDKARQYLEVILTDYAIPGSVLFSYTPAGQEDVLIQKTEVYDGAVPSGNSVMAANLLHMSALFNSIAWRERSEQMLGALGQAVIRYPGSFGGWAGVWQEMAEGLHELVVTGDNPVALRDDIFHYYLPNKVMLCTGAGGEKLPLAEGKKGAGKPTIYPCRNNTCQAPVFSAKELISLINRDKKP